MGVDVKLLGKYGCLTDNYSSKLFCISKKIQIFASLCDSEHNLLKFLFDRGSLSFRITGGKHEDCSSRNRICGT